MTAFVGAPPQWGTIETAYDQFSSGRSKTRSTSVSPRKRTDSGADASVRNWL